MSVVLVDGFKIYAGDKKSIIINSDYINEAMHYYKENKLDGIWISTAHDYKLNNVDFLSEYPEVKHLMVSKGIENISAIHRLKNLETLSIAGTNRRIDFSHFPMLRKLIANWSPNLVNMDKCTNLNSLTFYKYNPKSKDCSGISCLPWIESLKLTQATITTFNGLEEFKCLKEIEINYCSRLLRVGYLEKSRETLNSLLFDHCKSISNHEYVTNFQNLITLAYNNGGNIPSIKFVKKMSSLQNFMFVGTDVDDADMTPCIGLRYAAFTNKRYFSHTMEEIENLSKIK